MDTTPSANDNTGAAGGGEGTVLTKTPVPETTTTPAPEPEVKPEGDGKTPEGEQPKEEVKAPEVPEDYTFEFPEGIELNEAMLVQTKADFKAMGLTQEQAGKAMGMYLAKVNADQAAFTETRKGWVGELKTDKDYGGDKFDQTVSSARLALQKFDTDGATAKLLNDSGFGDHPAIVKLLARVHAALGEDEVHTDRTKDTKQLPLAERIYGADGMGPKTE